MKRKIIIVFISILVLLVMAILGLFAYLQISLFSVSPIMKSALSSELLTLSINAFEKVDDNMYQITLPLESLNDEITERFIQQEAANERTVISAEFDIFKQEALINYRKGNFYIPVFAKVLFESTQEGLQLSVIPLSYGKKQIDLPTFMDEILFHDIFLEPLVLTLSAADYFSHSYMTYEGSQLFNQGLQVTYLFELPQLGGLMQEIEQGLDEDFITVYANGTSTQLESLLWIDIYSEQPNIILGKIFDDFRQQGQVIKDLLSLVKPDLLDVVYRNYPLIETLSPRILVDQTRATLNASAVHKYGKKILAIYDSYVENKNILIVKNQPFDGDTLKGITLQDLNTYVPLGFPENSIEQFKLVATNNEVNVIYTTKEGIPILLFRDQFNLLQKDEYEANYAVPSFLEGTFTQDEDVFEKIYYTLFTLYQEDIYFRYLKDDGKDVFAIISKVSDYQNFDVVALRKAEDGSFKVLEKGITSIESFNKKHPDFNLYVATRMFENTTIQILNGRTRTYVYEGVTEKGYADADEAMIYCSFDGNKYISIVLSSGEKYIYTLYRGSFLEELYPLNEALERFDDIPPIILLQDIPGNNRIN
jgi:hypothetical protein